MSSEGKIPAKLSSDNNSGGRKTGYLRPQEHGIRCPRCDSANTKFCYYNNYSLSQPRYFCKTCRRYWTKGGALRNVPIGGGCRKNKKIKPKSLGLSYDSSNSPSLEFHQLGAIQNVGAITSTSTNPSSFDIHTSVGSNSLMGLDYFGYPSIIGGSFSGVIPEMMGSLGLNTSLASSIESLSCTNQDLHWKLQQERLGFVLGEEKLKQCSGLFENQVQKPEPICFQNLEMSKQEAYGVVASLRKSGVGGNVTTSDQWGFENSYSPTSNNNNNNNNCSVNGNGNISNWSGIQGWTDLHQYGGLP